MRRSLAVTAALVCVLAATGCESDTDRMHHVAADEHATPAEIVRDGGPTELAASGTGSLLVSYLAESDDDEGPSASAWRLYDPDGAKVAEGLGIRVSGADANPRLWSLPDGVLMAPDPADTGQLVRVADDGTVDPVAASKEVRPTEAGDVLLGGPDFYRPADATTYRLPDVPGAHDLAGSVVDPDGGLWLLATATPGGDGTVLHCPAGAPPCATTSIQVTGRAYPSGLFLAGDRLYVVATGQSNGGAAVSDLLVRDVGAPDTDPWQRVDVAGAKGSGWFTPELTGLDDDRFLLGSFGRQWYVGTPAGTWGAVDLPDGIDADQARLVATGGRLFALGAAPGDAYVSDDRGASWDRLPR